MEEAINQLMSAIRRPIIQSALTPIPKSAWDHAKVVQYHRRGHCICHLGFLPNGQSCPNTHWRVEHA